MKQDDPGLSDTLRAMAEEDVGLGTSPAVEARLRAEVRSMARTRRTKWAAVATLAAAAALVLAVALPWRRSAADRNGVPDSTGAAASAREVATGFFPLEYSGMPVSNPQLVRLDVPRAALASFGLTLVDVPDGASALAGTVQADVLVGEDGVARAVRFVGRVRSDDQRSVQERRP